MRRCTPVLALLVAGFLIAGCSNTIPSNEETRETLDSQTQAVLTEFSNTDPSLQKFLDTAHGYVIFPSVGKGGFIAGGAHGRGLVYEQGTPIGYATLTQATIGAQVGGQTFSEIIVFENQAALDRFRKGNYELAANASAVALKAGAATAARYENGVVIFVKPEGGLMLEAAVGGQKFSFEPIEQ